MFVCSGSCQLCVILTLTTAPMSQSLRLCLFFIATNKLDSVLLLIQCHQHPGDLATWISGCLSLIRFVEANKTSPWQFSLILISSASAQSSALGGGDRGQLQQQQQWGGGGAGVAQRQEKEVRPRVRGPPGGRAGGDSGGPGARGQVHSAPPARAPGLVPSADGSPGPGDQGGGAGGGGGPRGHPTPHVPDLLASVGAGHPRVPRLRCHGSEAHFTSPGSEGPKTIRWNFQQWLNYSH